MNEKVTHKPVFLETAIEWLNIESNRWYVDATFGRGGHTKKMLTRNAKVVAFDVDQEAIDYGRDYFAKDIENDNLVLIQENFAKMKQALSQNKQLAQVKFSGILFDFGTSTQQLKSDERGFSFDGDGELDMRMDKRLGVKAKDLLAVLSDKQLAETFKKFGGETQAYSIARAIKRKQDQGQPITTTAQLVDVIKSKKHRTGKLHPATKVFQALRIVVNQELDSINEALPQSLEVLETGGRVVTISFHEGEDRIAKHTFKNWQSEQKGKVLTPKPIMPDEKQVTNNARARSAKLRVFEKTV